MGRGDKSLRRVAVEEMEEMEETRNFATHRERGSPPTPTPYSPASGIIIPANGANMVLSLPSSQ